MAGNNNQTTEKKGKKDSFRAKLRKKLTNHFKFIMFDEAMFHEVFSIRLRPMNIVILLATAIILLIGGTILLIRYTSLKTYVISDDGPALRRQTALLLSQVDSMETKLIRNEVYLAALRDVLAGDIKPEKLQDSVFVDSLSAQAKKHIWASPGDSAFRADFEARQMAAMNRAAPASRNMQVFSVPVRGAVISAPYDKQDDHLWIGFSAKANTPVFAIAPGTVLYCDWTPESGNVMIIGHTGSVATVYKNIGLTEKKTGDRVTQGELIATTGSGANATSDPVVHFELWLDGVSVDPQDYINFGL